MSLFKSTGRKFTNGFLLVIFLVVLISFVVLRIYQWIEKKGFQSSTTTEQNLAANLQAANQTSWQQIQLDLQTVPDITSDDRLLGQIKAPAKLIVYSDLTDPLAAGFLPIIEKLKEQIGDQLVVAWRQHPLANNRLSEEVAIAVECAGQQGKFWDLARQVAGLAETGKPLDDLVSMASSLGLDKDSFEECLTKPEVRATIDKQSAEARALGAIGVPSSFLNQVLISGVYPLEDFVGSDGQTQDGLLKLVRRSAVAK